MGAPIRRVEDARFLTGRGRYVDDVVFANQAHGALVYSPHAHARIVNIDASDALAVSGVVRVFTGGDVARAGFGDMIAFAYPEDWGGPPSYKTGWPILARDVARFVGDRVAFVVAETSAAAHEAAGLVRVEYEPLPAVVSIADADNGPRVWADCAANTSFTLRTGDAIAADAVFARAAHVVSADVASRRVAAAPMEPRACAALHDAGEDRLTLWTTSQNPHAVRRMVAAIVMRLPEASMRVISPDVGGGFGAKTSAYPEDALVAWAARECRRPVRWTCARADALMTDYAGRDHAAKGELALDAGGRILALRVAARHSLGAYFVSAGASPARTALRLSPSLYRIPVVCGEGRAVFANTAPVGVYRGAGRPEANLLIERLLDRASAACGLDGAEIRRRNLPTAAEMPYTSATGACYDSGDFPAVLEACLSRADWDGFAARREDAGARGKLLGRSLAPYIESGGVGNERMEIRIDSEAGATIVAGTHSHGQGHATAWAQIVADRLALPMEAIRFVQGDTDRVSFGRGTYAARSSLVGGCALALAADAVLDKAKRAAAFLLQDKPKNIAFDNGVFRRAGANGSVSWREIAAACYSFAPPPGVELGLDGVGVYGSNPPNYPNGCHACEVEVDPETGETRLARYTAVDDIGVVVNPMICEGQAHGGLAQGVGSALMEEIVYAGDGQLLSGSFMDYAMPRAADFPPFDVSFKNYPATTNILGIKGVGETGIVASPAAIVNAILDALRPLGVSDIAMPATPARIFRAIAAARATNREKTP